MFSSYSPKFNISFSFMRKRLPRVWLLFQNSRICISNGRMISSEVWSFWLCVYVHTHFSVRRRSALSLSVPLGCGVCDLCVVICSIPHYSPAPTHILYWLYYTFHPWSYTLFTLLMWEERPSQPFYSITVSPTLGQNETLDMLFLWGYWSIAVVKSIGIWLHVYRRERRGQTEPEGMRARGRGVWFWQG